MSEFESDGGVRLCGKQREFYHVEYIKYGLGAAHVVSKQLEIFEVLWARDL